MPKYKVEGRIYDLPENEVQEFLIEYPEAELVTEEVDFPTSTVEDAGAVQQPMTASQAGVTELLSVDTSSELPEVKKPEEEETVLDKILDSEAVKKFKANTFRAGSNIAQIPAFVNRLKMTALIGVAGSAFEEDIKKFQESDSKTQDAVAQALGAFSGTADIGSAGFKGLEAAKELKKDAKKIEETLTQYDTTIGQDFLELDFSQAISRTFNEVVGTIPSIAQAMIPYVGISSIVAGSAADYSTEALAEGKKLDAANIAASTLTGFSEGLLEIATKRIGRGLFKNLIGKSRDFIEKTLKDATLQVIKDAGKEGFSEATTDILNRNIDAIYYNKGDEFDNFWPELADIFIIGVASGGSMSGTGALGVAGRSINRAVQVNSVNKTLEQNNSKSVLDEFELNPSSNKSINIAKNKYSGNILDIELKKKVSDGDISTEESESIKQKFNVTQRNVKIADDLNITEILFKETVDLLNERQSVVSEIAKAGENKSLVETQNERLKEIDNRLSSISAENKLKITTEKVTDIVKGIESVNIEIAENQEQADKIAEDKNLQKKASIEQGYILQDPKTGEQTIVINEEIAKKDFAVNVAAHELLHGVLFKTVVDSPDTAVNLGNALKSELDKIDANQIKDSNFKKRLELYKKDPDAIVGEETLTLFSDAIATGDLVFEENLFTRIGDTIRRVLQKAGLTGIKFNNGRDVYNFIKDYNKSIEKGKLTKAQAKAVTKGIEGELVKPKVKTTDETIVKEARSEEASQEVQRIYDEQGVAGAFDILEKFKPITNKIVERRRDAPNFDKQLLTDEIETGKRGIFDLIKEYKPESGVPLAAYINKFLPARAIEASKRVLGEEFTDDVTEAKGVAAEEVAVSVKEEPARKISPKKLKKYTGVVASNLGVSSSEVSNVIDKAIEADLKTKPIKTFGESRNIGDNLAKTLGKAFGLNPEVFTKKTRNIQKKELDGLRNLRQFLDNNAAKDFSLLPDAYAGPSTIEGKSTFIPNNILNALYRKNNKGKWEKDPTKTVQDYKDLLGKIDGSVYRAAEAQTIKGLAAMSFRNLIVEKAAETAEPKARVDIKAGAKFSKAKLVEISQARNINQVLSSLNLNSASVPDKMRADIQTSFEEAIKKYKLTENVFLAGAFAFSGATYKRKADGNVYYKLTNGKEMMGIPRKDDDGNIRFNKNNKKLFNQPTAEQVESKFGEGVKLVAGRGRLYYGVTDPAYKKALSEARKNSEGKKEVKAKRVNINSVDTSKGKAQAKVNMEVLDDVVNQLDKAVRNGMPTELAAMVIAQGYQATTGLIKIAAPFRYFSKKQQYGTSTKQRTGDKFREEHNPPASVVGASIIYGLATNRASQVMADVKKNYYQTKLSKLDDQKLDEAKLDATLPAGTTIEDNPAIRFVEAGIDLNSIINYETGKTMAEEIGVSLNPSYINLENVSEQNKIIKDLILGEGVYKNPQAYLNDFVKLSSITKASKVNNKNTPSSIKFSKNVTNQEALDNLGNIDKAMSIARNPDAPVRKIRVFDFDDTLARTKSNVLYTMPDGTTGAIDAATFAKDAAKMEADGAQWDFSEFSKVMQGSKGPLLDVAKIIADKRGTKDVFVLTARPADAAGPIKEFLESMGLNIPLENITGLGNGTPQAKARWIVDKAADGYNDFYFADDHTGNVKAVKDALSVLDVKSKVQQAYVKFSKASKLNKDFNDIIEGATGIASEKIYGSAKAQVAGANRGKVFRGIAYSAQDFVGLLYETLGKGKVGDAQMAWYKKNLLDPYARAMNDLSSARLAMMNDYRALKKQLGIVPKNLRKKLPGEPWTREQAVRVYIWSKQGTEVPGISKADLKELNSFVSNNPELQVFADQLIAIQKGDMYPEPGDSWVAGSISTDMLRGLNTIKRTKYLEQWQANVDAIFSKENKNKLEAAYGIKYVKALENSLERMKTGRNRSFSDDSLTGRFTDWLQGSIGAIMFFNTRSAVLQTLSAVNFVNFTDNNPYAAAKAFGNQKQYWKDFTTLMNSDFLKERRSGLRMNVNEADIADMAKQEGPRGVINKLLQLGFAPTQIADSFAIASGGATFYRNRIKTYLKEGLDQTQAEEKAFQDFRENAEESQQSSRPDKISAQQAGPLGRLILAFANTPAQYARLTDKAIRDLKNNRGDAKTNISKIIYYTTVQNIIFNAVQQALFAMAFGNEEPEDEKKQEKYVSIANGMADSLLRGTGIAGSVISVGKNAVIRIINESEKKRPKYEKVGYELTKISPPVSAKLSHINQAARAYEWNKEEMMTKGFSLDNPAFLAGGNVVSAFTNIPLDRVVKKINNVTKATESDLELWERVALFSGWQDWELNIKDEEKVKKPLKKRKKTKGGFKKAKFKTKKF